MNVSVSSNL